MCVAAEDEEYVPEKAINGLQGWIDCFEGVELKDTLFMGGLNNPNDIKNNDKLIKAYEMGKNI